MFGLYLTVEKPQSNYAVPKGPKQVSNFPTLVFIVHKLEIIPQVFLNYNPSNIKFHWL
jgi:hypothetical protein